MNDELQDLIAALRESEGQAREQLAELSMVYELAPVGLCLLDAQLRFVRINERLAAINGTSVRGHLGKTVRDVLPMIADVVEARYRAVLATGRSIVSEEVTAVLPSDPGREHTFLNSGHPVLSENGEVEGIIVVVQDITERKQNERELEAARFRLAEAQRIAKIGSWEWDLAADVYWWSEEMERLMGRPAEGEGRSFEDMLELVHPDDRSRVKEQLDETFRTDAPSQVQYRMYGAGGELRRVRTTAMLERDSEGRPKRLLGTVHDVGGVRRMPRKRLYPKKGR